MLQRLQIKNFAIIEQIDLEFQPGFTVITGETGAGKSIMVDAISLLMGARADKDWVGSLADRADLSIEFSLEADSAAAHWLQDQALDEADQQCLIRRVLQAGGGSRASINGRPAPLSQLQALAGLLVEIHGQHEHQKLLEPAAQRQLLDEYGSHNTQLQKVNAAYTEWQDTETELVQLGQEPEADHDYLELLQYQSDELQSNAIAEADYQKLEQEYQRLSNAGAWLQSLASVQEVLQSGEHTVAAGLHQAISTLDQIQQDDPQLQEISSMLNEALINTQEAAGAVNSLLQNIDLNPQRLSQLDQQLGRLHDLARKHRVRPQQLEQKSRELQDKIQALSQQNQRREQLEARLQQQHAKYQAAAARLSKARSKASGQLCLQVTELIRQLGMDKGEFAIQVNPDEQARPAAHGQDQISFSIKSNPGQPARALKKIASGGELSRIALAIKVASGNSQAGSQIFDEVDAGIGGDTANTVGKLLARLAKSGQALCVTHLAQVAAFADQQLKVDKATVSGQTTVTVDSLDQDSRVAEIARMLSGRQSEQSLAHAKELLSASEG